MLLDPATLRQSVLINCPLLNIFFSFDYSPFGSQVTEPIKAIRPCFILRWISVNKLNKHMQIKTIDFLYNSIGLYTLLAVLLLSAACQSSDPVDTNELFKEYFLPAPNNIINTAEGAAAQQLHEQAFRLYDQERYHQALLLFDEVLRVDKNLDILFFKANTLLVLGQYQSAYQVFMEIPTDSQRYIDSQWYAALAAMMTGDNKNSRQHLENISKTKSTHQTEAKELLRLLD